jgi:hypothetical protein
MTCVNKRPAVKTNCGVKKLCKECDLKYGAQYSSGAYDLTGLDANERMLLFIYAATGDISEYFEPRVTTRAGNDRAMRLTNEAVNLRDNDVERSPSMMTDLRYERRY